MARPIFPPPDNLSSAAYYPVQTQALGRCSVRVARIGDNAYCYLRKYSGRSRQVYVGALAVVTHDMIEKSAELLSRKFEEVTQ